MENLTHLFFSPLGTAILVGIGIILYLWYKSQSTHDCWRKRGIPYVKPLPIFGTILGSIRTPFHEVELERYRTYGQVYGHFEGASPLLSVGDPKHLRNILVKDFQYFSNRRTFTTDDSIVSCMLQLLEGEEWKRIRTIVTPTFTTGKIKRMMGIFISCSKVLVENFRTFAEKGEPLEVKKFYGTFTMDVIASAAFSTKIDSYNNPENQFVKIARATFKKDINYRIIFYLLFPRLMKFFKIPIFDQKALKFFSDVTLQIIEERKRTGEIRNDFLQLLMDTANEQKAEEKSRVKTDDILSNYEAETNDQVFKNFHSKKSLSFNELVAQCVVFFMAGYETTASTLAFVTYYLALNQDIQDKLIKELDEMIKANNGQLIYEAIQDMKYLDNVISETMRLSPPAVRLERFASMDYKLGESGLVIPKGTLITIPIYAIQRDEKYFPRPEKFDPDRFTPEERAKRDPYAFMPFGSGPRNCVGMRFALVEVKACLAYVLSHFRIKRCPQTKVPLEFYIGQGLLQSKDITVLMEIRQDCPLKE